MGLWVLRAGFIELRVEGLRAWVYGCLGIALQSLGFWVLGHGFRLFKEGL